MKSTANVLVRKKLFQLVPSCQSLQVALVVRVVLPSYGLQYFNELLLPGRRSIAFVAKGALWAEVASDVTGLHSHGAHRTALTEMAVGAARPRVFVGAVSILERIHHFINLGVDHSFLHRISGSIPGVDLKQRNQRHYNEETVSVHL